MHGTDREYLERKMKSIYIVENENGQIKIGVSENINSRISTLSKQGGFAICKLFNTEPCTNSYEIENMMHQYFGRQRTVGEWFDIDFETAKIKLKEYFNDRACFEKKYIAVPSMEEIEERFSRKNIEPNISEKDLVSSIILLSEELKAQYFDMDYPETDNEMFQVSGDYYQMAKIDNNKVLHLAKILRAIVLERERRIEELENKVKVLVEKVKNMN